MKKDDFILILEKRFLENMQRHQNIDWNFVLQKLNDNPAKLNTLIKMEETGGEVDVIKLENDILTFADCSKETPKRRSICYDKEARIKRKKFPPETSAEEVAEEFGCRIMNEEEYRYLQTLGDFDFKSSSWIKTPEEMRKLGGALFGDKRYDRTFIYHNGADSYYAARGFRGIIEI